jgi:Flp pilus assembly protein CpaB
VVAIVSGLLAFLLILSWMRSQQELVEVAVATEEIRSGNVVTAAAFGFVEVPADGSFDGRLISPEDATTLVGSVATRFIAPGEPILDSDLRPIETPEGLRAMSLPLQVNRAVGGALAVGDRVDIIGFDDAGARYIAADVAVLGIPGESSSAFGAGASYAITVAVDDVQALALAEALEFSELHVLRSTGAPEVTLERLVPRPADEEPGDGDARGDG